MQATTEEFVFVRQTISSVNDIEAVTQLYKLANNGIRFWTFVVPTFQRRRLGLMEY